MQISFAFSKWCHYQSFHLKKKKKKKTYAGIYMNFINMSECLCDNNIKIILRTEILQLYKLICMSPQIISSILRKTD